MHCPDCGSKLRKLGEQHQTVTTITYCDTHFRCAECDSEWVNEYDTYEQRSVLKRAVAEES